MAKSIGHRIVVWSTTEPRHGGVSAQPACFQYEAQNKRRYAARSMSSIPNRQYNSLCDLVREGPALSRKPSGHRHELRAGDSAAAVACMRRLAAGDIASFGLLYARHATPMYSLALRMLFHRQPDAGNVVYEVFEALWRGRGAEQPAGELAAWLLMQTRERALYRLRVLRITFSTRAMRADQVSSTATPDGPRLSSAHGQDRVSEVLRSPPTRTATQRDDLL